MTTLAYGGTSRQELPGFRGATVQNRWNQARLDCYTACLHRYSVAPTCCSSSVHEPVISAVPAKVLQRKFDQRQQKKSGLLTPSIMQYVSAPCSKARFTIDPTALLRFSPVNRQAANPPGSNFGRKQTIMSNGHGLTTPTYWRSSRSHIR